MVSVDGTVVLVTVVAATKGREGQDFFPLTVDYVEKFYSAGRIPGGFFKREGRPTEKETLTSRLIDRPVRPLFPEEYKNEVQVIAQVVSLNPEVDGDVPAMIGASAALSLAGIPFNGPIGAARVGYANGKYLLNPTRPNSRPLISTSSSRAPPMRSSWSNPKRSCSRKTSCSAPSRSATANCRRSSSRSTS